MRLILKHRRPTRWFHWLNFLWLAVMAWSGILIYWANDVYQLGPKDHAIIHFFPDEFYKLLKINQRLAEGMAYHFVFAWLFAITGLLYAGYTVVSGEWRHLAPRRHALRDALGVVLHDLHVRKTLPAQGRYNAAQQIAYTLVIFMGAGSLLTGIVMYRPVQLGWLTQLLGGYPAVRWEHFWLTLGFVGFFVIHIVQVARAGWNNFRSMVIGYELDATGENPPPERSEK